MVVVDGVKGLVADRPLLLFAVERNVVERFAALVGLQVELDAGIQAPDASSLHFGGQAGVTGGHFVDFKHLADRVVPVVTPNNARLATLQAFSKSTGKNNVPHAVLVTDSGNEALNKTFSLVNIDLTRNSLELSGVVNGVAKIAGILNRHCSPLLRT